LQRSQRWPRRAARATSRAGYRFISVGGKPIQRPFGRFVFAVDPDGILVEFVEPSMSAQ